MNLKGSQKAGNHRQNSEETKDRCQGGDEAKTGSELTKKEKKNEFVIHTVIYRTTHSRLGY